MEFVESQEYEKSVGIIKSEMSSYYSDLDLAWDDEKKLEFYCACFLWAIRDDETVGFAMTREEGPHFYLAELHIEGSRRNKGYGAKSIQLASEIAASLGYKEIRIRVFKNNPAHKLYLRSGFTLEKELPYTYQLKASAPLFGA
jgi:ribosomal protein S18 acetylase RimI-like enzyme